MKISFKNRRLILVGIVLVSQALYLLDFKWLLFPTAMLLMVFELKLPSFFNSLLLRLLTTFLLLFSLIQFLAAFEFILFPDSLLSGSHHYGFAITSLGITVISLAAIYIFPRNRNERLLWWTSKDSAALLCALFFILPLTVLFFKSPEPSRIVSFTGVQSPDAVAHYMGISEMTSSQELTYRTNGYYPKGFHIASAFVMDSEHLTQQQGTWTKNLRIYAGLYVFWGTVVALLAYYLGHCIAGLKFTLDKRREYLLALTIGPFLCFIYLLPFVFEGFLNYYFVIAAVLLGCLLLAENNTKNKLSTAVYGYFLLTFAVSMSWGPLLAPALFLLPILICSGNFVSIPGIINSLKTKTFWVIVGIYVVELLPLYLHFKYAHLTSSQGINALGIIRDMHYGIVILGIITAVLTVRFKLGDRADQIIRSILLPFILLVTFLLFLQFFTAGEPRYYAIKTSYLFEIFVIISLAIYAVYYYTKNQTKNLLVWAELPLIFFAGFFLVTALTANPLLQLRQTFRHYAHYAVPNYYDSDVKSYAMLGSEGKLFAGLNIPLHYVSEDNKYIGNGLLMNSSSVMQYTPAGTPETAECSGTTFSILTYGDGSQTEQQKLKQTINGCVKYASEHGLKYYIITDSASLAQLHGDFGSNPEYIIQ